MAESQHRDRQEPESKRRSRFKRIRSEVESSVQGSGSLSDDVVRVEPRYVHRSQPRSKTEFVR